MEQRTPPKPPVRDKRNKRLVMEYDSKSDFKKLIQLGKNKLYLNSQLYQHSPKQNFVNE